MKFYEAGRYILVSLDLSSGHEQKGSRPVLVVTPEAFNSLAKTPIVVPITTGGNFARVAGFTVNLEGLKTIGVVRCDQPRALNLAARNARKLESVPAENNGRGVGQTGRIDFLALNSVVESQVTLRTTKIYRMASYVYN